MLLIARKNLFSEKTRLAISVGGIALSVFLIGILLALFRGWSEKVGDFVENVPADLWIGSDGTTDFIAAASLLPDYVGTYLDLAPEIDLVSPLIVRPTEMRIAGHDRNDTFDVQLVAYDPAVGLGGPLRTTGGKEAPGPGEIIVDREMAKRRGIDIGDRLVRSNKSLTVVGFSSGGDFIFTQVAFIALDTAADFYGFQSDNIRSFYLVTLHDPGRREALSQRLELSAPGIEIITGEFFAQETRDRILGNVLPILIVVLVVAFVVGLAVAGLTIYTATVEKSREYGILKAEGFTNPYLYRVVFEQSLITAILGFAVGAGLTVIIAPFAQDAVPQFVVFVRWQDIVGVAGATLIMALLAAYIPVRRMASIDPVTVFKG